MPPARVVHLAPADQAPGVKDLTPPFIVKPLYRDHAWKATARAKALLVESRQELSSVLTTLAATHSSILVQQHVPGPESRIESYHVYVDSAGEIAAEFTGRKLRTYPRSLGHSTALVTTSAEDVACLGRRITYQLGLRGVAKFDFKRDADGRLWLLEVNPRFNLWHRLGAAAGVNIPAIVAADLLRLPRPRYAAARSGVGWCRVEQDWLAARQEGVNTIEWLRWVAQCEARGGVDPGDPMTLLVGKILAPAWERLRRIAALIRGE